MQRGTCIDPTAKTPLNLAAESFFFEWVAVEVVAVLLPETGLVVVHEFEAADPFDAFPGVQMGHDEAQRVAVIGGERFAIVFEGEECGGAEEVGERDVGGIAVFGFDHDVGGAGADADPLEEVGKKDAFPADVEAAPAGDAVHVGGDLGHGEAREFVPGEAQTLVDHAGDFEIPGLRIEARDVADVEDWPLQGEGLIGREAAGFAHGAFLAFPFGEIFEHGDSYSLDIVSARRLWCPE